MAEVYKLSRVAPVRQQVLGAVADGLMALLGSVDAASVLRALGQLGDALELQAVFVAEHRAEASNARQSFVLLHQWHRQGISFDADAIAETLGGYDHERQLDAGHSLCLHPSSADDPVLAGLKHHGVRTLLAVPIMIGTKCWGHLGLVDLEAEQTWNEEMLSAISAVAAAFGASLERQRAFEAVQRHAERIRSLHAITSRYGTDLSAQITDALALAAKSLDHELGLVTRIVSDAPSECTVVYGYGYGYTEPLPVGQRFPIGGDFFGDTANRPVKTWPGSEPPEPVAVQHGVQSYISSPIWVDGEPFGIAAFVRIAGPVRPYSQADQEFVQIVANWIGSVLDQQAADARRAALESRLEHSRRLESLSVALGGIAHDFNNLLMVTATGLGLAEDALAAGDSELVPHLVKNARRATDRATELTGQLMTFSGRHDLTYEPTDLHDLVRPHVEYLGRDLGARITVDNADGSEPMPVPLDAASVREVVRNLVINAHEANGGAPIRVRCGRTEFSGRPAAYFVTENAPPGHYGFIEVEDSGPGIPEQHLRRVFEPFFTTKFAGRGLGLSEAVGVIRSHRGAIDVDSTPGHGTRIRLLFPMSRPVDDAPKARPPESSAASPNPEEHILLVDDEDMLRDTLQQALQLRGISVDVAANGEDALELLRDPQRSYTAVILDVTMPVMDGRAALLELRKSKPSLPVVLVSGYTEENVGAAVSPEEPTAFLQKPFGTARLLSTLRSLRRGSPAPSDE